VYYFFRSWKESVSLFIPKQARLFFLITLKSIIESYKLIALHLWWLFGLSYLTDILYSRYFGIKSYFCIVPLLSWFLTIFFIYLIIRPSIKRKGWSYYKDYLGRFAYFVLFSIIAFLIPILLLLIGNKIAFWTFSISWIFYMLFLPFLIVPLLISFLVAPQVVALYTSPLLTFLLLFMLDSNGSISDVFQSIIRAFKMVIYNYPFCIIMFIVFIVCSTIGQMLIVQFFGINSFLLSSLVTNLILPIPLCILTNFYIKRLHDQFGLYYPETVKE
jgi:hypothetical protein